MNTLLLSNASRTITTESIAYESFKLTESLSAKNMTFGACETTSCTLRIRSNRSVLGEVFDIALTRGEEVEFWKNMTVVSDVPTADMSYRDIELRDAMDTILTADVSGWYNSVLPGAQSAVTLKQFRDSFFNHFGVEQEAAELPNDSIVVRKTVSPESMTGKKVITAICQLNGCFGHVGRDGKFQYIFLNNENAVTLTASDIRSIKNDAFVTEKISKVHIRATEDDIGGSYGSGTNVLVVQDNFLMYGCSSAELTAAAYAIYETVKDAAYTPIDVKTNHRTDIPLGQRFSVDTKYGTIYSYKLKNVISGILSVKDNMVSTGTRTLSEKVKTTQDELIQMRGKTNELTRTVEGTESRITELQAATIGSGPTSLQSQINQQAGQINLKVSQEQFSGAVDDLQRQIDNASTNYNVNYVPTLGNFPAFDWAVSPLLDISPFDANGEIPWIYTDEEYAKHTRTSCFDETTGITYRFGRSVDGTWGWAQEASPEYSSVMRRLSEIEVDVDGITQTVQTDYLTKDAASGTYATQSQLKSQLEITATGITQSVSETYQTISAAQAAAQSANKYADSVGNAVLTSAESKIQQTSQSITSSVSETYQTKADGEANLNAAKQYADGVGTQTLKSANSSIQQTASNILSTVSETYVNNATRNNDILTLNSSINQTSAAIIAEAERATSAEDSLSGRITVTANEISSEVSRAKREEGNLSSRITQTESSISSKVSKGSVISEINQTAESVTINAGKINLSGIVNSSEFTSKYATITQLNAVNANFNTLNASNITSGTLSVNRMDIDGLVSSSKFTAKYATISSLDAVNGKFENLNASKITSGTLSVERMDVDSLVANKKFTAKYATVSSLNALSATVNTIKANYITASYINASNICGALRSAEQGSITIGTVRTQSLQVHDGRSYHSTTLLGITINGVAYRLVGYRE